MYPNDLVSFFVPTGLSLNEKVGEGGHKSSSTAHTHTHVHSVYAHIYLCCNSKNSLCRARGTLLTGSSASVGTKYTDWKRKQS